MNLPRKTIVYGDYISSFIMSGWFEVLVALGFHPHCTNLYVLLRCVSAWYQCPCGFTHVFLCACVAAFVISLYNS